MAVTRSTKPSKAVTRTRGKGALRRAPDTPSIPKKPSKSVKRAKITATATSILVLRSHLLELPAEVRLLIYDLMVDFTGVVIIYSKHELSKEINKDSMALLHVCQLMREEVKILFYRSQVFRFCSVPAINHFLSDIGRQFASNIRNVQITPWLGIRKDFIKYLPDLFERLDGVERLTILNADSRFVSRESHENKIVYLGPVGMGYHYRIPLFRVSVCQNTLAILEASTRLSAGKIYYLHDQTQPEMQMVPSDIVYSNALKVGDSIDTNINEIVELEVPKTSSDEPTFIDAETQL